ncbi:dihydroorotate dehydrogenase [Mycobacterium antarcticum]|uniref:dihydroorotate dehydrogenase-like protein n=1 Tax=unclassified Mycolicibacterium TaxID=2636767 RepID=UPI002390887B|nr:MULTISPECIES: dihydroorotate dehydrogenase-like protein [unclassified Mycolicibacterium]BDX33567.1 dihydroorotate dehydrogenase [Mycolicibacterium sp. TUM20985]GLP76742.1 dihydroorotate dehydrogenase [Mycolicibacterium sp. TUM20983]GLP82821.1 dihydroorotate dehydrogenase [Mycolicibacterium sp. TUM20984]
MDLATRYLGLTLSNPLIASASPLSKTVDGVKRLADAGVGAVVLYSLFEEQLRAEAERDAQLSQAGSESFGESLSYFPRTAEVDHGPRQYLSLLERASAAVSVPVIASLNGSTPGSWARYAHAMQESGAAAIELNVYYLPGDAHVSGRDVERRHLDILAAVKDAVSVPVAVKLSPYFSATAEMARSLDLAGADGLVLFNRFLQPDVDVETLAVAPGLALSRASEARLPMTWIALLHGRIDASLAATTGVEGSTELIKYLLAGANVVMTASALLRHGPGYATVMLDELRAWMERKGYGSIDDVRGLLAVPLGTDEVARERGDYVSTMRRANHGDYGTWGEVR